MHRREARRRSAKETSSVNRSSGVAPRSRFLLEPCPETGGSWRVKLVLTQSEGSSFTPQWRQAYFVAACVIAPPSSISASISPEALGGESARLPNRSSRSSFSPMKLLNVALHSNVTDAVVSVASGHEPKTASDSTAHSLSVCLGVQEVENGVTVHWRHLAVQEQVNHPHYTCVYGIGGEILGQYTIIPRGRTTRGSGPLMGSVPAWWSVPTTARLTSRQWFRLGQCRVRKRTCRGVSRQIRFTLSDRYSLRGFECDTFAVWQFGRSVTAESEGPAGRPLRFDRAVTTKILVDRGDGCYSVRQRPTMKGGLGSDMVHDPHQGR